MLGFAWTGLAAERAWQALLPRALEDTAVAVAGRVASFPLSAPGRLEFELAQVRARGPHGAAVPTRIAVRSHTRLPPPALGAWCELKVRLRRPRGFSNPGGHDRVRLALARGIGATAVVVTHPGNLCVSLAAPPTLDGIRTTLARQIADAVSDPHAAAVLRALTVDDRSALSAPQWERMRRTGTAHLLAISGLQISLCAGLAFSLCRIVCALADRQRQSAWPLRAAWYGALAAALAYTAIGGAGVPLMRATLMLACAVAATLAGVRVCSWHTWWLSLAAVLTWQPLDALSAGMWLSFAAVAALIALAAPAVHPLHAAWRTHLALCIALAPLTALVFGSVAWIAPLANLIAVPWCNLLVVPLALAGLVCAGWLPAFAATAWDSAARLWTLLDLVLAWLARAPPVNVGAGFDLPCAVLASTALVMCASPRALALRRLACAGLLLVCLPRFAPVAPGDVRLLVLDVGQGLAVVVLTARHTLLYDSGPRWGPTGADAGQRIVVPALRALGRTHVDRMLVSHADLDHAGGAASVYRELQVADVRVAEPSAHLAHIATRACARPLAWEWDAVEFRILHPAPNSRARRNAQSCVLAIRARSGRALLTGDIEQTVERELVRTAAPLAADVLVVPHHGSASSSSGDFVRAVAPRFALVSSGYRNRYGLPHATVVARYRASGAAVHDTALGGALVLDMRARGVVLTRARDRGFGFWRGARE